MLLLLFAVRPIRVSAILMAGCRVGVWVSLEWGLRILHVAIASRQSLVAGGGSEVAESGTGIWYTSR